MESAGSCWRSIYNFRPETELSDEASESANKSSERVGEELMKHGYVVGRIGEDGTRRRLMKLSKVVFHIIFIYNTIKLLVVPILFFIIDWHLLLL